MVRASEGVQSLWSEDWSKYYPISDHWLKYWSAVSAPSGERLTEDRDRLFLKGKPLVPANSVEDLTDHWNNSQLMPPGRDDLQKDIEARFCSLRVIMQC